MKPETTLKILQTAETRLDEFLNQDEIRDGSLSIDHDQHVVSWSEYKIKQAADLSLIQYDQHREALAKSLNLRVSTLDNAVNQARKNSGVLQDAALPYQIDLPWQEPVDGAALVSELMASVRMFVALPDQAATALALWVLFTYAVNAADYSPIMAITAPEKRCGKTTLLNWLSSVVAKPLSASNMTPAAVFRSIEKWQPTLLIDEADTFLNSNEELRGVLNCGHSRQSAFVIRTVGDDHEPKKFSTWGPKAIVMIGNLPETLADRSIHVEMRRRMQHEMVKKMRGHDQHFSTLRQMCARFAQDNLLAIQTAEPHVPDILNDRAADNWSVLLSIASVISQQFFASSIKAAIALSGVETESPSANVELLGDIQSAFVRAGESRLLTNELINLLCEDDEAPWSTWNKGKPITPRQLARRLNEFGITTNQTVRARLSRGKGFKLEQFTDAFDRYLPVTRGQPCIDKALNKDVMGDITGLVTLDLVDEANNPAACPRGTSPTSNMSVQCVRCDGEGCSFCDDAFF